MHPKTEILTNKTEDYKK